MIISRGAEISITRGGEEIVRGYFLVGFVLSILYLFKVQLSP